MASTLKLWLATRKRSAMPRRRANRNSFSPATTASLLFTLMSATKLGPSFIWQNRNRFASKLGSILTDLSPYRFSVDVHTARNPMTTVEMSQPVAPGQPAPHFTLPAVDGDRPISLSDYRGRSPVFLALLIGLW